MIDKELGFKYFGGSPQCTEENLDYFILKLKEYNANKTKITFREWLLKMMILIDLID